MPVEVIKYTCQFKCHHKAINKREQMVKHESRCWNNPDNKACNTCKNQIAYEDNDGMSWWPIRSCKISELANFFDQFHEILRPEDKMRVRPIYNCPYHNKESDEEIHKLIDRLVREIGECDTGTYHLPYHIPSKREEETKELF